MPESTLSDFGSISDQVGIYASQKALYQARKNMFFYRIAVEEEIPKGHSTVINFRRWLDLNPAISPIQGAITPSGEELQLIDINSTLQQYGKWVPIPRHIQDTVSDPILARAIDRLSYNMRLTFETIDYLTFRLGSQVFYSGTAQQRNEVNSVFNLSDLRNVVATLEGNDVEPITELIHPNPNVGTVGVEPSYFAICHSYLERAVRDLDGFTPAARYPEPMQALPQEIGNVENVRFIRFNIATPFKGAGAATTSVLNTNGNADVYPILIFGKEAIGCSKLAGTEFTKILVHNAKVEGNDPLGQRSSAGWLGWHSSVRLEENYLARLESSAGSLS